MSFFISPLLGYYENDRLSSVDIEVPQRPSLLHIWNGAAWVIDAALQTAAQRAAVDVQQVSDCQLDATIMNLVNQTRAEWRAWAGTNFLTLTAPERTKLGDLFWVVSLGVRRVVRNA